MRCQNFQKIRSKYSCANFWIHRMCDRQWTILKRNLLKDVKCSSEEWIVISFGRLNSRSLHNKMDECSREDLFKWTEMFRLAEVHRLLYVRYQFVDCFFIMWRNTANVFVSLLIIYFVSFMYKADLWIIGCNCALLLSRQLCAVWRLWFASVLE